MAKSGLVCRRANEEVPAEFSMEQDIVEKQKQWISVALRTDSDSPPISKHNGKSYTVIDDIIVLPFHYLHHYLKF